ncbi:DUF4097 family beta strand repeat-containing protein [Actinomadura sp. BRA 177]|uniref:DUF4097 family beta strand repeat-containing protein n=1 Tax=Actinomadura sp. BRA 177 TaxID=2745202 RepID=UPI0015959FFD|nr:DUF4097 family beta strand repeat-containing protein [Actinomadura sp. BRA 177]NVI93113.1 DUF4097 family beta strand repeat protein [Actinomadura sp. BRA 177]
MRTLTGTAVLAAAAVALVGCGNVSFGGTRHEDRSYDAPAGVTTLKIQTHGSRVEVTASDSPGITVNERLSWSNEKNKPTAKHTVEGGALKLISKCGAQVIGFSQCGVSYRIRVPRSTPVQIDNKDGSIVASGLAGTVKLHSDNGSITATDLRASTASLSSNDGSLRVSGRVTTADLSSNNGSVDASGLTADTLKARSKDGRIRLSGNVTTADLDTSNGSIDAHGLTVDRLTAETKDGGINLRLTAPPTSVKATSANGSVHLRLPVGETYAISVSTDNGSKRIDPALHQDSQSKRRIELDTKDGSVSVEPSRG